MTESKDNYDYSNNTYYFVDELGYLKLYQKGSLDLAFTVHKFNKEDNIIPFKIDKDKYPKVYELITSMFNEIEKLKYLRGTNRLLPEYEMLYEKGYFSWKSDAPADECWNHNEHFKYHYFNIHKDNNSYIFEFICSLDTPFFTVEVNTDRSRYEELRFPVWDFFNKLKNDCDKVESDDEKREILKFYHDQKVKQKTISN